MVTNVITAVFLVLSVQLASSIIYCHHGSDGPCSEETTSNQSHSTSPMQQSTTHSMPSVTISDGFECPKPGEVCSSDILSENRCCGGGIGTTKCDYASQSSQLEDGIMFGTCCVKSRKPGCLHDSDCCEEAAVCNNFVCEEPITQASNDDVQEDTNNYINMDVKHWVKLEDINNANFLRCFTYMLVLSVLFITCIYAFWCNTKWFIGHWRKAKRSLSGEMRDGSGSCNTYEYYI
eukprot:543079_1